jgi:hypothetical protein
MAQTLIVLKTCDLAHDEAGIEASETIDFALDGYAYQLDVCTEHSDEVHNQLQDLIAHARRASGGRRRAAAPAAKAPGSSPEELAAIREWARKKGYTVSDRGRISGEIRDAYAKAKK